MGLLLMDLDNTVADRAAAFGHWLDAKLGEWGPGDEEALRFVTDLDEDGFRPRVAFLNGLVEHFGLAASVDDLLAEYRALTLEGFPPIGADVCEALVPLRADGWRIGIVTNGESGVQEATVERVGLTRLIDACVVSDTVGVTKPDPRIFELAAEQCGTQAEGGWMIGDADVDIRGAANSGMRSIWLTRGREWTDRMLQPDLIASSLLEALIFVSESDV